MSPLAERRGERNTIPRVLAIASHPIQYHSPWFRALAAARSIDFSVLFIQQPDSTQQGGGFGLPFQWDIPLLEGYRWQQAEDLRGRGGLNGFFSVRVGDPLSLVRQLQPDIVVLTGWHIWPLVQMLIAARRAGVPVIMRGEANALRRRPLFVRGLHRLLLDRCSAFLPIGSSSRDFYRTYGIAEHLLFDTPYFVDNARFSSSAAEMTPRREELRARWNIPAAAICYCYAGKLEPKKRILDLLQALSIAVARSSEPLHLLVVGSGELLDQARAMSEQLKLPITFAGFLNQTEIPAAYVASDCLVLPSDYGETWGLVVNEAMACGRPAIVSDHVGCGADLVIENETGAVFPFGDIQALADQLVKLADADRLRQMGARARRRVLESYSVEKSVDGVMNAIRHVLGRA